MLFNPHVAQSKLARHASPGDPGRVAVEAALTAAEISIRAQEQSVLAGSPQGIHKMRAAARRLRGELRTLAPLIDDACADRIETELRWLGQVLGNARDLDVLRERLKQSAGELGQPLEPLFARIDERRLTAIAQVREALESDRYRALLASLSDLGRTLTFTAKAELPCRKVVPRRVRKVWSTLKRKGRALQPGDADEALHLVRKKAKRVRYAAELASRVLSHRSAEAAARFARQARQIQDVLGRHQDAVVALRWIEESLPKLPEDGAFRLALGRLMERQHRAADESRAAFPRAWSELDCKKLSRWL